MSKTLRFFKNMVTISAGGVFGSVILAPNDGWRWWLSIFCISVSFVVTFNDKKQ